MTLTPSSVPAFWWPLVFRAAWVREFYEPFGTVLDAFALDVPPSSPTPGADAAVAAIAIIGGRHALAPMLAAFCALYVQQTPSGREHPLMN